MKNDNLYLDKDFPKMDFEGKEEPPFREPTEEEQLALEEYWDEKEKEEEGEFEIDEYNKELLRELTRYHRVPPNDYLRMLLSKEHYKTRHGFPVAEPIGNQAATLEPEEERIDTAEAMEILDVSRKTLQTYLQDKKLPAKKEGGKWYMKRGDVEALKEKLDIKGKSGPKRKTKTEKEGN